MKYKYFGCQEYSRFYGKALYIYGKDMLALWKPQIIIPVPLHRRKQRIRGFNQAELLAKELSRYAGIPVDTAILKKCHATRSQKKLDAAERKKNLQKAFQVVGNPAAFGIGGAAMIAAPGVTRFVGAGGMEAARAVSEEMAEIYLERNMQLQIPGWDFQGACLGLDIRRVVETGITPLINTGIAHKEAGIGQIGAGTVRAPLACFEQALEALAESMGIG